MPHCAIVHVYLHKVRLGLIHVKTKEIWEWKLTLWVLVLKGNVRNVRVLAFGHLAHVLHSH